MFWYVLGALAALGLGIWAGLGYPGLDGPRDRVVGENFPRRRIAKHRFLDWLRPPKPRR